jgi:hypothetical protein
MKIIRSLAWAAIFAAVALGQTPGSPGMKVPKIPVSDLSGTGTALPTAGKTTVVIFISTQCPVSNDYSQRMKALYGDYSSRANFVFINSNATEPAAEVEQHAKANAYPFAVWKDPNNVAADLFGAQATPETYVIDQSGVIEYHGSIDDARNPARVTRNPLRDALDSVLAGKQVTVPETKAFGCSIKRSKRDS